MNNIEEERRHEIPELQRLRDENTLLRSLLHDKFTCSDCSTNGPLQKQLDEIRNELSAMKTKQQVDTDENKRMIEKIRAAMTKKNQEKSAKAAQKKENTENVAENQKKEIEPTQNPVQKSIKHSGLPAAASIASPPVSAFDPAALLTSTAPAPPSDLQVTKATIDAFAPSVPPTIFVSTAPTDLLAESASNAPPAPCEHPATTVNVASPIPNDLTSKPAPAGLSSGSSNFPGKSARNLPPPTRKPKAYLMKFAGNWKLTSSEDCERYLDFLKITEADYLKDIKLVCDGKCLKLPEEPEVTKDPTLIARTEFEDKTLRTVLNRKDDVKQNEIVINRTLNGDYQLITKTIIHAFYNLTNSRQTICCTRVYDRVN